MDELMQRVVDGRPYAQPESLEKLGISAIVLSGSTIYCHAESGTLQAAKDLDGAVIVPTRQDVVSLVLRKRKELTLLLGMECEEQPALEIPAFIQESSEEDMYTFDGLRLAGYSATGAKVSFKLLSMQCFGADREDIALLSNKDRRVFEGHTTTGCAVYRLMHSRRVSENTVMVYDDFWMRANPMVCQGSYAVAFGVTADLLMTGYWLPNRSKSADIIRGHLLDRLMRDRHVGDGEIAFARGDHFKPIYQSWLNQRLAECYDLRCLSASRYKSEGMCHFLSGPLARLGSRPLPVGKIFNVKRVITEDQRRYLEREYETVNRQEFNSIFANNSRCYIISFGRATWRNAPQQTGHIFFKEGNEQMQETEVKGALEACNFYPHTQVPSAVRHGLVFPFFDGKNAAEMQLEYFQTGNEGILRVILDTELRKAEDMLRAYRKSMKRNARCTIDEVLGWQISRFYCGRLASTNRLTRFYRSGVFIHDNIHPLEVFLEYTIRVNGEHSPCLALIHNEAERILRQSSHVSEVVAFGLGDAHGANIMLPLKARSWAGMSPLYVDYEVSGWHPPALDVAKPIFHDLFFSSHHADHLPNPPTISYGTRDGELCLDIKYRATNLTKGILEVKLHHLLKPLAALYATWGLEDKDWVPVLASALFSCALLTRDYNHSWDTFFLNLAIGSRLAPCRTLEELERTLISIIHD